MNFCSYSVVKHVFLVVYVVDPISQDICQSREIRLTSQQTILTSQALSSCGATSDVTLVASAGQTMNISLWNFKPSSASMGTLSDKLSGNTVEIVGTARYQALTSSVGREMTMRLQRLHDSNFMVEIQGKIWCLWIRGRLANLL